MVTEAVLPPGARPLASHRCPPLLRDRSRAPRLATSWGRTGEWTVAQDPSAVVAFLKTHVPSGFVASGVSTSSSPTERAQYVIDQLRAFAPNVSDAGLEIGVARRNLARTTVRADAVVGWTEPRPADEYVPAADSVVIVSVIRVFQPGKPVVRRVVVTDPAAVAQIARAFGDAAASHPPLGLRLLCRRATRSRTGSRSRRRRPRLPISSRPPLRAVRCCDGRRTSEASAQRQRRSVRACGRARNRRDRAQFPVKPGSASSWRATPRTARGNRAPRGRRHREVPPRRRAPSSRPPRPRMRRAPTSRR